MHTVNIHEAKTHLSRLIADVEHGEQVTIARAGTPVARLVPVAPPERGRRRLGTLVGRYAVPDDLDAWGQDEVRALFEDGS